MNKAKEKNYINKFSEILNNSFEKNYSELTKILKLFQIVKRKNNKILIFGNGGSAAIANHIVIDFNKVAKLQAMTINNSSTITCLSNDYGYENWIKEVLKFYLKKNDLLILISSSGVSRNMINACREASKHTKNIVTFTGFKKNNKLSKMGKINIWIDSKHYNYVENIHQILLLYLSDKTKEL